MCAFLNLCAFTYIKAMDVNLDGKTVSKTWILSTNMELPVWVAFPFICSVRSAGDILSKTWLDLYFGNEGLVWAINCYRSWAKLLFGE